MIKSKQRAQHYHTLAGRIRVLVLNYMVESYGCHLLMWLSPIGEEVKDPQRAIPLAILLCLVICFVGYAGVSATLTLLCPYFLLNNDTPLVGAFQYVGFDWAYFIISGGAICALTASLLGVRTCFPSVVNICYSVYLVV